MITKTGISARIFSRIFVHSITSTATFFSLTLYLSILLLQRLFLLRSVLLCIHFEINNYTLFWFFYFFFTANIYITFSQDHSQLRKGERKKEAEVVSATDSVGQKEGKRRRWRRKKRIYTLWEWNKISIEYIFATFYFHLFIQRDCLLWFFQNHLNTIHIHFNCIVLLVMVC